MTAVMVGHPVHFFFFFVDYERCFFAVNRSLFTHPPSSFQSALFLFVVLVPTNLHDAPVKFRCRVVRLKHSRRTPNVLPNPRTASLDSSRNTEN